TLSTATGRSKLLERDSFTLLRYDINIDNYKTNKDGYLLPTHEEPKKSITNNKNVNNNNKNKKSNNKKSNSNSNSNNNNNKNKSSNNYSSKRNVLPNANNKNVNNNKLTVNTSITKEPQTPTNKISKIKLKSRFIIEEPVADENNNNNNNNKKSMGGKTRKHQGIHQSGGKKGKLKKGYRYSGKKLKSGISQIIKCKRKK
ncbi:uncharacterized protein METZ01_LOCUS504500, partial [marine metagenome]